MWRLVLFTFLGSTAVFGQQQNEFMRAVELGIQHQHEMEMQKQRLAAEAQMQRERLAVEQQKIDIGKGRSGTAVPSEAALNTAFNEAIVAIAKRHPDLKDYAPEMQRISTIFSPGASPELTMEGYLEGLFAIAKYSTFSKVHRPESLSGRPLTNADVLAMVKGGLEESIVIFKVQGSPAAYQLEPEDLLNLKNANVQPKILQAMIEASKR